MHLKLKQRSQQNRRYRLSRGKTPPAPPLFVDLVSAEVGQLVALDLAVSPAARLSSMAVVAKPRTTDHTEHH